MCPRVSYNTKKHLEKKTAVYSGSGLERSEICQYIEKKSIAFCDHFTTVLK